MLVRRRDPLAMPGALLSQRRLALRARRRMSVDASRTDTISTAREAARPARPGERPTQHEHLPLMRTLSIALCSEKYSVNSERGHREAVRIGSGKG